VGGPLVVVEQVADAGRLEDVAAKPLLGELVCRVLDRRQLLEVADQHYRLVRARGDDPERRDRRHRRLVQDHRVEGARLHRLALVGAGQRRCDHRGLGDHQMFDLVERFRDDGEPGLDLAQPCLHLLPLGPQRLAASAGDFASSALCRRIETEREQVQVV